VYRYSSNSNTEYSRGYICICANILRYRGQKKALLYSIISDLSELLGVFLAYIFLTSIMSDQVFGIMSALAGGIMIFISMDELLPTAIQYGEAHIATYGLA